MFILSLNGTNCTYIKSYAYFFTPTEEKEKKSNYNFHSIVPTSNEYSQPKVSRSLRLFIGEFLNTQDIPPSRDAIDHLLSILQRVHSSEYGHSDPRILTRPLNEAVQKLEENLNFDIREFWQYTSQSMFADELKNEWGMTDETSVVPTFKRNVVVPDSSLSHEVSISKKVFSHISYSMRRAVETASSASRKYHNIAQHDAGTLLMYMFVADLIGQISAEGQLFDLIVKENLVS
jgi:hypothetical protein